VSRIGRAIFIPGIQRVIGPFHKHFSPFYQGCRQKSQYGADDNLLQKSGVHTAYFEQISRRAAAGGAAAKVAAEAPSSNIQAPGKLQPSNFNGNAPRRRIGYWILKILWMLDVGAWSLELFW